VLLLVQCLELDYRKPQVQQIAQRLQFVCQQEGLTVNDATLRTLIEGAQGDIRLVLGHLQVSQAPHSTRAGASSESG
jgi:DNA polymerase III delta prime subunit